MQEKVNRSLQKPIMLFVNSKVELSAYKVSMLKSNYFRRLPFSMIHFIYDLYVKMWTALFELILFYNLKLNMFFWNKWAKGFLIWILRRSKCQSTTKYGNKNRQKKFFYISEILFFLEKVNCFALYAPS